MFLAQCLYRRKGTYYAENDDTSDHLNARTRASTMWIREKHELHSDSYVRASQGIARCVYQNASLYVLSNKLPYIKQKINPIFILEYFF